MNNLSTAFQIGYVQWENAHFNPFFINESAESINTAKIIAENLSISDKTVSTYRSRILKKMNMKSTAALIHYAIENNISD